MENHHLHNWSIEYGDYHHKYADYNKLYNEGKRKAKMKRFLLWTGAAFLSFFVFLEVLAYAAAN